MWFFPFVHRMYFKRSGVLFDEGSAGKENNKEQTNRPKDHPVQEVTMNFYKGANGELVEVIFPAEEMDIVINGQPATKVEPGTSDGAHEKHVPAISKKDDVLEVQVGEVLHPMLDKHWITSIWAEYPDGTVVKKELNPGEEPVAAFDIKDVNGKMKIYEYCNLHGLWENEIDL